MVFWIIYFFLLSVHASLLHTNYTLSRKKQNIIIRGGTGSIWGDNFYMGTQNGSKLEILPWGILIHALELKLWPFKVFP